MNSDSQDTCKAAREKMKAALAELAHLRSHRPMSHEAFAAQIQRIAVEHAEPCGCELHVQAKSDGLLEVRVKVQKTEVPCDVCKTIECFFHSRTD